jgi:hypothetical protein
MGLDNKAFEAQPDNIKSLSSYISARRRVVSLVNHIRAYKGAPKHAKCINAAQIKANADYEAIEYKEKYRR